MTKINKLGKSTFVIAILSFLLVAVLAFGGTYAYFSASADSVDAKFTTGTIKLSHTAPTVVVETGDIIVPGAPIVGEALKVSTTTNVNSILFAVVKATSTSTTLTIGNGETDTIKLSISDTWTPVELTDGSVAYVYNGGTSNHFFNDESAAEADDKAFTTAAIYLDKSVTNGDNDANMGVEIELSISFYVAQYDYLSGVNGQKFEGTTAKECYSAAQTHVFTSLVAAK